MATAKQTTTGPVIQVTPNVKTNFRPGSARALYWQAVQAHNGKPLAAFVASVAANPPSTPQRGKLKGKPEPVAGWVSWFTRNGYISVN